MVSVTPQYKSMLLVALVPALILVGAGFFLFSFKDYFTGMLFYSSTKNIPFLASQGVQYQGIESLQAAQSAPSQTFATSVRTDEKGKLFAVWDDKNFTVWSIGIFEIPDIAPQGMPDPLFLIRSALQGENGRTQIQFLASPYKLGETPKGFEVFPQGFVGGTLALASGKKYFVQALSREETLEGVMTREARFSFIYGVPSP